MRRHISVHRATTKYFSNLFVFKTKIEKEGLPGDITPALGAGGPRFKSGRPDQFMFFLSYHLAMRNLWFSPLVPSPLSARFHNKGLKGSGSGGYVL